MQTVVATPEATWQIGSDLSKVGNYAAEQVRDAIQLVSREIIIEDKDGTETTGTAISPVNMQAMHFVKRETTREFPQGHLHLTTHHTDLKGNFTDDPTDIKLRLTNEDGTKNIIKSNLPLADETPIYRGGVTFAFTDFRDPSFTFDTPDPFTIEAYRKTWRGTRWVSANLLNWGELVLPEQLDT